ncbi:response regulator transcription factor [Oceanobacillus chungangensis]|nr:response regulator [Oceanobacillus chungangensis]
MRILLAEDELIERKAMRKFIEENFPDIEVVAEAENGRKAIELAAKKSPDVMFMDIRMPGINGLEAIEKINTENPAIKFILVSAYDSFDYAKEAMRFGIKDYILKPGRKEEIVKAILRVQKEIEAEKMQQQERIQALGLRNERFITELMHAPLQESTLMMQKDLFPKIQSGCFFVVKHGAKLAVENSLQSFEKETDSQFITHQVEDIIVVCFLASTILQRSDISQVARRLQQKLGDAVYVGIGSPTALFVEMPKSYEEAYEACMQLAADGKRQYGFLTKGKFQQSDEDVITRIEAIVEKGQQEETSRLFQKYQDKLTSADKEDLYIRLKNGLISRNIAPPAISFSSIKANQDWYTYLHLCSSKMREYYQSKSFMEQAKKFIHTHSQEAITLENAAASVNLSASYFSNVFKQEFGMNFIEYLTMIRMQKAKGLIEENVYSLKEISFMVGYKDPNYFSRVFKKYYKESPKQFQQAILRK